ncbi:MAG TPA: ABC transporter ATP-binding protein [bacterium]|nr:ABC transporter ATP-binding protein [bacterium]
MAGSTQISLELKDLRKKFKIRQALDGVTGNFEAATLHGLIGPDGAGKTTLLRILIDLLHPDSGEVRYFLNRQPVALEEIRPHFAYMPQQQSLYPDLSVIEHLAFFRELYRISKETYLKRSAELLHLARLEEFKARPAGQLSGGMYKKLGLLCALLQSPEVVLLDEPTTGVDPISRRELWEMLYRLVGEGILVILSTAYMDEAERCGRVHILEKGRILAQGEPRKVLEQEGVKSFEELFLRNGQSGEKK